MKRFKVRERRVYTAEYLIEATDATAAGRADGTIIDETPCDDDTGLELLSVEEVSADTEAL